MHEQTATNVNGDSRLAQMEQECQQLRKRVADLERERDSMAEALEYQFRRDFKADMGVTYEEFLANPEKYMESSDRFSQQLDRLLEETR